MSKKVLIFGLLVALSASLVGGALAAQADYIYPYGGLQCAPALQTVNSGDLVNFSAYYNSTTGPIQFGQMTWQAVGGTPVTGTGTSFSTRFYSNSATSQVVTVTDGYQSATCNVTVSGTSYSGQMTINHTVQNITRGGSGTSVTAYNGDRLHFVVTVTTGANQYAYNAYVRDWLPQYVSYVNGSTTINGASTMADTVTTTSLPVGSMSPNSTLTVAFDGTLNGASNMTLTNTANVHVDGFADQTRTSTISVAGSIYVSPTPTPISSTLSITAYGRNVTLGQSAEYTSVVGHSGNTLDVVIHVRNSSVYPMYNAYVTDIVPSGLNYISRSSTLNGMTLADGVTTSGINIGTLNAGQEAVVKFSAAVDPNSVPATGQVDLINTAQVRADGFATIGAQLPVTLGNSVSIAAISKIKTGPADTVLLALLVSTVVTGIAALFMDFSSPRKELNFLR